jgi:hypothetical protein
MHQLPMGTLQNVGIPQAVGLISPVSKPNFLLVDRPFGTIPRLIALENA